MAEHQVVALVGPTASGKSELAVEAADRMGAEVVAVDAFTVYRGMDIGTAKPPPEVRARVPHHLIDVLDPSEDCTVQWFQEQARQAIAAVRSRGRAPLLVGGSGLYFRAVVDPLEFPPTDPRVRREVWQRYAHDPPAAHAALAELDAAAAALIDPENLRRSVRALEVLAITGRPFSRWRSAWNDYASIYPGLRVVGVVTGRQELLERIDRRVDTMYATGLLRECAALRDRPLSRTAAQAIGYAEGLAHLDGACTLEEAVERTRVRTRRYAARQRRWFERDPRVRWTRPADVVEALVISCSS